MSQETDNNIYQILSKLEDFDLIERINKALPEHGECYLVGGALRDLICSKTPKDFDLTSNLSANELTDYLQKASIRVVNLNTSHQTVTCIFPDADCQIEITSFHGPNATPAQSTSIGKSILEDLNFRDFTINAMALNLKTKELIDPFAGRSDISAAIIRAVDNARLRFEEDPLRIIRMIRFSAQLGYEIEGQTFQEAKKLVPLLKGVAVERFRDELLKILLVEKPSTPLLQLQELGILEIFIPELEVCVGFGQNRFHDFDVFNHTMKVLDNVESTLLMRLTALFHDIAKPLTLSIDENGERHFYKHEVIGAEVTKKILKRLCFSSSLVGNVEKLVGLHMRSHHSGPTGIRRILRDSAEHYSQWRDFKEADARACLSSPGGVLDELLEFDTKVEEIKEKEQDSFLTIAINGNDIIDLGLKPSRQVGDILDFCKELVLESPEKNTREVLLEEARRLIAEKAKS